MINLGIKWIYILHCHFSRVTLNGWFCWIYIPGSVGVPDVGVPGVGGHFNQQLETHSPASHSSYLQQIACSSEFQTHEIEYF